MGATLHVVSAFDSDRTEVFGSGSDQWIVSDADGAENVARTVADSLAGDVKVTYSAARGKPAEALIKEAERLGARMIVVGNRRMRGIGRVLGSVANSVAHNATCDVYIANTYADGAALTGPTVGHLSIRRRIFPGRTAVRRR